jgi:predicted nucleic acid-binding protein
MVENAVYRYRTMSGRGVRSPTLADQRVEVQLACRALNTMTHLGMPTATERARLRRRGRPPSAADGQIAAIARVNELVVVTVNPKDFRRFQGLAVEDWSR